MKKEVIEVSEGKKFVDNIPEILRQAKGNDVYLDDELIHYLIEKGNDTKLGVSAGEYDLYLVFACNGLYKLQCVKHGTKTEYIFPNKANKQLLIILA